MSDDYISWFCVGCDRLNVSCDGLAKTGHCPKPFPFRPTEAAKETR